MRKLSKSRDRNCQYHERNVYAGAKKGNILDTVDRRDRLDIEIDIHTIFVDNTNVIVICFTCLRCRDFFC